MLCRICAIRGPVPTALLARCKHAAKYFTWHGLFFERRKDDDCVDVLLPKPTTLADRMGNCGNDSFVDFVGQLLRIDPAERSTARKVLRHPFLSADLGWGMSTPPGADGGQFGPLRRMRQGQLEKMEEGEGEEVHGEAEVQEQEKEDMQGEEAREGTVSATESEEEGREQGDSCQGEEGAQGQVCPPAPETALGQKASPQEGTEG